MECMELWGGSSETDMKVSMTGLRGQVRSTAFGSGTSGGDVYFFSSCASGRISRVLLADVTGHGEAVANTGLALRDVMRRNVNVIRQSKLMAAINEEFGQITSAGGFATAVVATHFAPTNSMTISIAGHPPPLLYRAAMDCWSVVEGGSLPAGSQPHDLPLGIDGSVDYTTASLTADPNDILLMYTDAFTEARGTDSKLLGMDGLLEVMNEATVGDRKEIIPWLIDRLKGLSGQNLIDDDATIIALQTTGRRIPMKDNLFAPWRMMRGVHLPSADKA